MPTLPTVLQQDFTAGIRRSRARDQLGTTRGANVLWDARDWIIGRLGVPLGKRGGWGVQGGLTGGSYVRSMHNSPFNGGNFMRAIDKDGAVWVSTGPDFSSWFREMQYFDHGSEYTASVPRQNGVFIGDGLQFPSRDGSEKPSSHNELYGLDWDMASGGAGDYVVYLAAWNNRMVGLDTHENLWFGDPTVGIGTWDEDAKYFLGQPGRGLVALGRELLVFFDGQTRKVTGSTPAGYGITDDDIVIEMFAGDIGCVDAFSICDWGTRAIWVDHNGVWATDGAAYPIDLAWSGNAVDLFREFMSNYVDRDTTRVACGFFENLLLVSMTDLAENEAIDTLVCDLNHRTWSRWTNAAFSCMVRAALDTSKTYAGVENYEGAVATLDGTLDPAEGNKHDGNGVAVEPSFETAYYRFGPMNSRLHQLFLGYELTGDGEIEVQAITTEATLGTWTLNGQVLDFDASVADVQDVLDGLAIEATCSGSPGAWVVTWNEPGEESTLTVVSVDLDEAITVATTIPGEDPPKLKVEFATDPGPTPTFGNWNGTPIYHYAKDITGADDEGYHWRSIPVRTQAPGIAIKVSQVNASNTTAVHSLGSDNQPHPVYSET